MTWARSWPVFAQSFDTPLSIFMLSLRTLLRTLSCVLKKPVLLRTPCALLFCVLKKPVLLSPTLSPADCHLALVEFDFCSIGRKW